MIEFKKSSVRGHSYNVLYNIYNLNDRRHIGEIRQYTSNGHYIFMAYQDIPLDAHSLTLILEQIKQLESIGIA